MSLLPTRRACMREMAQKRIASNWEVPKSYKRIRIVGREDIELTYPLITAYLENPHLALSVEHFVLDESSWPSSRMGYAGPDLPNSARPIHEDAHKAIENYVRTLGLEEATTQRMLLALYWKKQFLEEGKQEADTHFHARNTEYGYAATIVLLSLCKNITTLHLGATNPYQPLGEYIMKSNYGLISNPALQELKSVEYLPNEYFSTNYKTTYIRFAFLDWFRYFHRLPEIESATIEGVMQYETYRNLFAPNISNVKRLRLGHSHIYSSMLGTIIRMHKGLEELSISLGGMIVLHGIAHRVYPKTIGKSLLTQKDTLRILDLDMDIAHSAHVSHDGTITEIEDEKEKEEFEAFGGEEEALAKEYDKWFGMDKTVSGGGPLWVEELPDTRPYQLTIGSLHDFTALKRLSIGIRFLMGPNVRHYVGPSAWTEPSGPPFRLATMPPFRLVDALPPNLEYLCLRGYFRGENPDVDDHINELLEKKTDRFPHLKEVEGIDIPVPGLGLEYGKNRSNRAGPKDGKSDTDMDERYIRHLELDLDWIEI